MQPFKNRFGSPAQTLVAGSEELEESKRWLEQQVWTLPVLNDRSAEEILGYGHGDLCD